MGRNRHVPTEKINSKIRKQIISTLSGNKKPLEFKNPNGSFIIYRKTLNRSILGPFVRDQWHQYFWYPLQLTVLRQYQLYTHIPFSLLQKLQVWAFLFQ